MVKSRTRPEVLTWTVGEWCALLSETWRHRRKKLVLWKDDALGYFFPVMGPRKATEAREVLRGQADSLTISRRRQL